MKEDAYTDIVCKRFCTFYKEGKEELHCAGYEFVRRNLTAQELGALLSSAQASGDISDARDAELKKMVCDKCEFLVDGCDFRADRSGPPCGGYKIIDTLIRDVE